MMIHRYLLALGMLALMSSPVGAQGVSDAGLGSTGSDRRNGLQPISVLCASPEKSEAQKRVGGDTEEGKIGISLYPCNGARVAADAAIGSISPSVIGALAAGAALVLVVGSSNGGNSGGGFVVGPGGGTGTTGTTGTR